MKIAALLYEYEQGNILVTLKAYHTFVPSSINELLEDTMRILICCGGGFSSSYMMKKVQKEIFSN
jgi:1,6-anhydro-N-acetylmuramate kinase